MPNRICLASKSPRRRELLGLYGWEITVLSDPSEPRGWFAGDEEELAGETPAEYVHRTAVVKLMDGIAARDELGAAVSGLPVLAADTVVSIDGRVLGKPRDRAEVEAYLRALSGRAHEVRTVVAVGRTRDDYRTVSVASEVEMRPLSEAEIRAYASTNEPYDKAGGYGIQGLAGLFVRTIRGSYTAIMGLPVCEAAELLALYGAPAPVLAQRMSTNSTSK